VIESPPDEIMRRLNNGRPAGVREAAERLREYVAGLYGDGAGNAPELGYLAARVSRRLRAIYPHLPHRKLADLAEDVAAEMVGAGYIEALAQLSGGNTRRQLDYVREVAESTGASCESVLLFGVRVAGDPHRYSYHGGTDKAFANYVVAERLRGIHRPGLRGKEAYRERFSLQETRRAHEAAEGMVRNWPLEADDKGELAEAEIPAERGKLPADFGPARREFYGAPVQGRGYTLGYLRPPGDRSFEMVEDMATIMLSDTERPPLPPGQAREFDELVTEANRRNVNPWAYAIGRMPGLARSLAPAWEEAKNRLHAGALTRYERTNGSRSKRPRLEAWPSWEEELQRLQEISTNPRLRIVYPPQLRVRRRGEEGDCSMAVEGRYGLRVPAAHERLISTLRRNRWFAANCDVVYDDTRPYASREIARLSLGDGYNPGKRYEIAGSWGADAETGRGRITIYRAGFDRRRTLAEEIYHAVYDVIRSTGNGFGEKVQAFARRHAPSRPPDEAFASAMASETVSPGSSRLPGSVVEYAAGLFRGHRPVPDDAMKRIAETRGRAASYQVREAVAGGCVIAPK
jgi:hypothetical protein